MPITGPTLLSLRPFKDGNESMEATMAALQGVSLSSRPDLWRSYVAGVPDILKAARPATQLKTRFTTQASEIDQVLASIGRAAQGVVYMPMAGRKSFWTVFLDPVTAEVLAYMPLDSF